MSISTSSNSGLLTLGTLSPSKAQPTQAQKALLDFGLGGGVTVPVKKLNDVEKPPASVSSPAPQSKPFSLIDSNTLLFNTSGGLVITPDGSVPRIDLGGEAFLTFDPNTLEGKVTPSLASKAITQFDKLLGGGEEVFSGSDIRLMMEIADPFGSERWAKQFTECTTITVSVHRVKDPARACGYIGAKGYSRGGRTIAGSIVLTEFTQDVLFRFLSAFALRDKSKDTYYAKVDQLPPFNITMLFTNEKGYASFRRILGVELVTDGTVYSINDAFSERTISYVASDFTTLMPLTLSSLYAKPKAGDATMTREKTVMDVMRPPIPKITSVSV